MCACTLLSCAARPPRWCSHNDQPPQRAHALEGSIEYSAARARILEKFPSRRMLKQHFLRLVSVHVARTSRVLCSSWSDLRPPQGYTRGGCRLGMNRIVPGRYQDRQNSVPPMSSTRPGDTTFETSAEQIQNHHSVYLHPNARGMSACSSLARLWDVLAPCLIPVSAEIGRAHV